MKNLGFLSILLFFLLCLSFPITSHAAIPTTHIYLDDGELDLTADTQVQNVKGSVMVPLRVVAEQLNYSVKWNNMTKTAIIEREGIELKLVINDSTAEVAGAPVKLETPPFLSNGNTFVPLRFIGEETGTLVRWDNITKTVYLTSPTPETTAPVTTNPINSDHPENSEISIVNNINFEDNRLIIAITGESKPTIFTMTEKDRIVVDLPNSEFSSEFIHFSTSDTTQSGQFSVNGYPGISSIRYSMFSNSPPTIRVVLDLEYPHTFSLIDDRDGLIVVDLNQSANLDLTFPPVPAIVPPAPQHGPSGKQIVVIDPGHGGKDPGAISLNNRYEKNFTLPVSLKIQSLLNDDPNIEVILTRDSDVYPSLQDRAELANRMNAALFVSIHANSIPKENKNNPSGSETYYTRESSLQFAQVIHKYLVPATTLPDRGIRKGNLYVTRETTMPAILLECGYLSNAKDEELIYTDDFQQRVAEAVVHGIKEYLGF